jgi:hypothetical protein
MIFCRAFGGPRWLVFLACVSLCEVTQAGRPPNISAGEMAALPEYCIDTQGFGYGDAFSRTSPRAAHWVGLMGPSFWHHHHYCWGLISMRRGLQPGASAAQRQSGLASAIPDFEYVIEHSAPDFVMLPEVYFRLGEVRLYLGDYVGAKQAFDSALARKADYWPAFQKWAEVLFNLRRKPEALLHLETGMRLSPGATALHDAYRSMGGNPERFLRTLPVAAAETNVPPPQAPAATSAPAN